MVKPLVQSIKLTIYDRGFYSKDLMLTLTNAQIPYLIFMPKNKKVKNELDHVVETEKKNHPVPVQIE
jgi:hypothetical protein